MFKKFLPFIFCFVFISSLFFVSSSADIIDTDPLPVGVVPADTLLSSDLTIIKNDGTPFGTSLANIQGCLSLGTFSLSDVTINVSYTDKTTQFTPLRYRVASDSNGMYEISFIGAQTSLVIYNSTGRVSDYLSMIRTVNGTYNVDNFSFVSSSNITDYNLFVILLGITDFAPRLNGTVRVSANRTYSPSVRYDGSNHCTFSYNGDVYGDRCDITLPVTTQTGGGDRIRVGYIKGSSAGTFYMLPTNEFTVTFHDHNIRDAFQFYNYLVHQGNNVMWQTEASAIINGSYIASNDYFYLTPIDYNVSFSSRGESFSRFRVLSSVVDNITYQEIYYDDTLVYSNSIMGGTVLSSSWVNPRYMIIDFGADYKLISATFAQFVRSYFTDGNSPSALDTAYQNGLQDGYSQGKRDGIAEGIKIGEESAHEGTFLGDFFGGIVDALDKFVIFGSLSLYDVLKIILGFALLLIVLKVFAGG